MSKNNKYMMRDVRPLEQPEDTYPFGKNGIQHDVMGLVQNEPGFLLSDAVLPYKYNGVIETSKHPVIFSCDGVNSAIGYYDEVNDVYIPLFNDADFDFKLGLQPDKYITGESQSNYLGEVVVSFTDKTTFPKYFNCDNPNISSLNDFRLFPLANLPTLDVAEDSGGALLAGAYYVSVRYRKNDGTQTGNLALSDVTIINGTAAELTDRALSITLTDCDPEYDQVVLAIISKVNGVVKAVELEPIYIGANHEVHVLYTGANFSTDITLEEVLIDPASYNKVQTMGQLNDALYIMGLEKEEEIKMQQHAMLTKLEWVSSLETVNPPSADVLSGKKRGFMHEEVYAWYIRYSLTSGGWTKAFHVPGPSSSGTDEDASTEASAQGITTKKYQVEDTIHSFNVGTQTGTCGVWINQTETYPDTIDYDASAIGGRNLRGLPVLHHRMPSIRWCKANLYPFDAEYGRSELDILGIKASNIIIPTEYSDKINGYQLLYARRTLGNSTVIAQSLLLHAGRAGNRLSLTITGPDTDYISTGGNWHARKGEGNANDNTAIIIDRNLFRFHSFDMLFNKPAVTPSYMSLQLRHQMDNINHPLLEDFSVAPGEKNGPIEFLIDYMVKGNTPTAAVAGKLLRKVSESQYVPNNLISGKWKNLDQETAFGGKISNPVLETSDLTVNSLYTGSHSFEPEEFAASKEVSYLCNLMNLRTDLYLPFNGQSLISAGRANGTDSVVFFGGDIFINDYCFHTYGWNNTGNDLYGFENNTGGIKAARRFVCEAASNINARFQLPANEYSKWYPKFPLIPQSAANYLTAFVRSIDPNQFGYNKDLNSLNDLISAAIFNPIVKSITSFPYRIHRGGKLSKQTDSISWRTFLPLDYYEMQKNMGLPIHLEGMDDHLLIHMENALFLTQDKTKLDSGLLSVTLGTGDIFQFEPQEEMSSKLGYAGTQHDLACVRTPAGYVFIDSKQGQIFIHKGQLKLMNEGLGNFFRDFLRLKDKNIFIGNGYTIGYDPDYRRILLTCKNLKKSDSVTGKLWYNYQATPEFIAQLTIGDLIYNNGRWQKFLGINSTIYSCTGSVLPTINDTTFTIPENEPNDTSIGTLTGTNVLNAYITGGNSLGGFRLDPTTMTLRVNNQAVLDFETTPVFTLTITAYSSDGHTDTAIVTVNLTDVAEPPSTGNFLFEIPEHSPNTTEVGQVLASDPNGLPLTYAIVSGNALGIFTINGSTGMITVANNTNLDIDLYPTHLLRVSVSNGTDTVTANVKIGVTEVNQPPVAGDVSISIFDTTPTDAIVYTSVATDPENTLLSYELLGASVPGVFTVNPDGTVKLNDNSVLNGLTTPQYTVTILVRDSGNPALTDTFILTINILFDPSTLEFEPATGSCTAGCAAGWTLSDDGTTCTRITTVPATPPTGGITFNSEAKSSGAYTQFGTLIYAPGYTSNGVGTFSEITTAWWKNIPPDTIQGPLNRTGLWLDDGAPGTDLPFGEWIGFSKTIVSPSAKTVYIGMGGDNEIRVKVNGTTIIEQDPSAMATAISIPHPGTSVDCTFKYWHVYPVNIPAGTSIIEVEGKNDAGIGAFGFEIYDNTSAEVAAATSYAGLTIILSSKDLRGTPITNGDASGYSCGVGYSLDTTTEPPTCKLIETDVSSGILKVWANVKVKSTRLVGYVATLTNTSTPQTFQGITIPYYAPVPNHIDCGGGVTSYVNVQKNALAAKNDCVSGIGTTITYYVQKGRYMSVVSQAAADTSAQTDADTNKQSYANAKGICII